MAHRPDDTRVIKVDQQGILCSPLPVVVTPAAPQAPRAPPFPLGQSDRPLRAPRTSSPGPLRPTATELRFGGGLWSRALGVDSGWAHGESKHDRLPIGDCHEHWTCRDLLLSTWAAPSPDAPAALGASTCAGRRPSSVVGGAMVGVTGWNRRRWSRGVRRYGRRADPPPRRRLQSRTARPNGPKPSALYCEPHASGALRGAGSGGAPVPPGGSQCTRRDTDTGFVPALPEAELQHLALFWLARQVHRHRSLVSDSSRSSVGLGASIAPASTVVARRPNEAERRCVRRPSLDAFAPLSWS